MENVALEASIRYLLLEYLWRTGNEEAFKQELTLTGTPHESDWWVIGPFENKGGFHKRFPPEKRIDLKGAYKGADGKVSWRKAEDTLLDGHINLEEIFSPNKFTVAYGLLSFECPFCPEQPSSGSVPTRLQRYG